MGILLNRPLGSLTTCVLAVTLLSCSVVANEQTILFVDDADLLYRAGAERIIQPAKKRVQPVMADAKPWELAIGYCSVHRRPDTGEYQAWYQSYAGGRAQDPTRRVVLCYATSQDGFQWEKPDLGLFDFNDEKKTNIVLVGNGGRSVNYGAAVVHDEAEKNPQRRYKLAYWDFVDVDGKQVPGLCVACSPDGIHWKKFEAPPRLQGAYGEPGQPPLVSESASSPKKRPAISDVIDLMIDPESGRYVIYSKTWIDGPQGDRFWKRAVVRTESSDFIHWSEPMVVMTPTDDDFGQLHGAPVFVHHGVYFSLVQRLDFGGYDRGGTGNMPSELATSRDGIRWQRPFQDKMFLPVSGDGKSFDAGCLWTNGTPVILKDEIRFYYGSYPSWHSDFDSSTTGIGVASIPRDRFAALQPREEHAQVTLKPRRLTPDAELRINAAAESGQIHVELLSAGGYRIPGFTKADAIPITGDQLDHQVQWREKKISDLPAGDYQIRVHLENAKLFAITVTRPST